MARALAGVTAAANMRPSVLYLVTEDWYFVSHRLDLARGARDAGFKVIVGTRFNDHREILQAEGFTLYDIPFERSMRHPMSDFLAWRAISRLLRNETPSIVHLVSLKPILLGGLASRGTTTTVLMAFTGMGYIFSSSDNLARLLRPFITFVLRIIAKRPGIWSTAQNRDDADLIRERNIVNSDRLGIIAGSGVDTQAFNVDPTAAASRSIVLFPARLLRDKGVHEFVEAARIVRETRRQIRFVLAGAHDLDNPAVVSKKVLDEWQRMNLVEWWGDCRDMAAVYAQARIVCLPSYREGLPKALLEAAACGRPLVATDVPGCREICRDGETGLLVPVADAPALARAIMRLLDDDALAERFGRAGRQLVLQEYSSRIVIGATLALYQRMLAAASMPISG
jgi:glycosyltransferase involved in cell wall biosynthesis